MTQVQPTVLVVDFGAQYAQLIARRVREANIYSEVVPHTITAPELAARNPAAIVLSGGPSSVYEVGAPHFDESILELGIPVFGICYGFQAMAQAMGGKVDKTGLREFGGNSAALINGMNDLHTGRGNADKAAVIAAMQARGFRPADDNEADALALLLTTYPKCQ